MVVLHVIPLCHVGSEHNDTISTGVLKNPRKGLELIALNFMAKALAASMRM